MAARLTAAASSADHRHRRRGPKMPTHDRNGCLTAVAAWKLEERGAENLRYFYETPDMAGLYNGELCFVIGRKGSGKTALAEHILNMNGPRTFVRALSFQNFPFAMLASFEQDGFATASRYANIWKYIIYVALLEEMARNAAVDPELRLAIDEALPRDLNRATSAYIRQITDRKFGLKIMGSGADVADGRTYLTNETSLPDRVAILERTVAEHIDQSAYYVLFDDLDDDFDHASANPDSVYARLLGGLFRAAIDVNQHFGRQARVYPIVFLRDDIYDLLYSNNKAKWTDKTLDLRWRNHLLHDLVAHRIYRAADARPSRSAPDARDASPPSGIDDALGLIFDSTKVRSGRRRRTRSVMAEIERRGYGRPRDVIAYMRLAARDAVREGAPAISTDAMKRVDRDYSNYLLVDLIDELHTAIPDIRHVFKLISKDGKASLPYGHVAASLETALPEMSPAAQELGAAGVIDALVRASVLGKQLPIENQQEFRYQNPYILVSDDDKLYIHRGLHAALAVA